MAPDRASVVKSLRLELDTAAFGLGQVTDSELEGWLFKPGSDRIHLVQWCLGQLNPSLWKLFQASDENEAEKRAIEQVKLFGICHDEDVILGTGDQKAQIMMWLRMLQLLQTPIELRETPTCGGSFQAETFKQILSTVLRSKDFTDLLHTKILAPVELRSVSRTFSKKDIEEKWSAIVLELEELQAASSDFCDDSTNMDRCMDPSDQYNDKLCQNLTKIQECYQTLESRIFTAIPRTPGNPIGKVLGDYIGNLADHVIAFVQMLKDLEDIHRMSQDVHSSLYGGIATEKPEVQQYLSECHSCVSEILSLWRLHNIT